MRFGGGYKSRLQKSVIRTNRYNNKSADLLFLVSRDRWGCNKPNMKQEECSLQANRTSKYKAGEVLEQITDRNCAISIFLAFKKRLEISLLEVI